MSQQYGSIDKTESRSSAVSHFQSSPPPVLPPTHTQELSYQQELESATDDLANRLASSNSEEEASQIMQEHSHRMQVLEARHESNREEQIQSLKRKLADRRTKRTKALHEEQEKQVDLHGDQYG